MIAVPPRQLKPTSIKLFKDIFWHLSWEMAIAQDDSEDANSWKLCSKGIVINWLHDEENTQCCGRTFMRNMDSAGTVYRSKKCIFVLNSTCDVPVRTCGVQ